MDELELLALAAKARAEAEKAASERSFGDALYDNVVGNPDDGVTSYGESLGTWIRRATDTGTLGIAGDEVNAAGMSLLPGRTYESELDRLRQDEANMSDGARFSADIAGAFAPGIGAGKAIAKTAGWGKRALAGAGAGAAGGGTLAFNEAEGGPRERLSSALFGAGVSGALGGAIPMVGAGVRAGMQNRAAKKLIKKAAEKAPSSDELRALGGKLYQQIDDAGVQIKPESFDRMRANATQRLRTNTGFDELPGPGSLTPNSSRVMGIMGQASEKMADEPSAALPFRSLDQMRRQAGAAAGNVTNKADQKAGMEIINTLDDFVKKLRPEDIVDGDVASLQSAIPKARQIWSRMSNSQLVDDAIEASEDYLSGSASGIRNQFKNILRNKKLAARFTDAEKKALRRVTHPGAIEQIVNLAGGGLGQMASMGGGAAIGGLPGFIAGTASAAGQRKLSEVLALRGAERARAAIASGKLREPGVLRMLEATGQKPEMLTNSGLLGALLAGGQTVN